MDQFNYQETQQIADELIGYFGQTCMLIRDGTPRPCVAVEIMYNPHEFDGQIIWHGDRRFYVSPVNLAIPPDADEDYFQTNGLTYRVLTCAPMMPKDVVQYYELQLRR